MEACFEKHFQKGDNMEISCYHPNCQQVFDKEDVWKHSEDTHDYPKRSKTQKAQKIRRHRLDSESNCTFAAGHKPRVAKKQKLDRCLDSVESSTLLSRTSGELL